MLKWEDTVSNCRKNTFHGSAHALVFRLCKTSLPSVCRLVLQKQTGLIFTHWAAPLSGSSSEKCTLWFLCPSHLSHWVLGNLLWFFLSHLLWLLLPLHPHRQTQREREGERETERERERERERNRGTGRDRDRRTETHTHTEREKTRMREV